MLLKRAKALEHRVGALPDLELDIDDLGELMERGEESVMEPEPPEQLPDALNGVKLRAIGRKEMEGKIRFLQPSPSGVEPDMVVLASGRLKVVQ
jgi:hypothetical protein